MKNELKRFKRAILVVALLLGASVGAGAALLSISLTKDTSPMTLGGLVCLLLTAILAIVFGVFVHLREVALARLEQMESLFGKGCEILSMSEFETVLAKEKRRYEHVYAVHMRLGKKAGEEDVRFARLSLADLLFDLLHEKAIIAYSSEADFVLVLDDEKILEEQIAEIDRHLRRNPRIVPYGLYLGKARLGKVVEESIAHAIESAYADTLIRNPLSVKTYIEEEAEAPRSIDIATEIRAKRLRFKAVVFSKADKKLYYLSPELYDPVKGPLSGKDFRNAMALAGQSKTVTDVSLQLILGALDSAMVPGPVALELSEEALKDPSFLLQFTGEMISRHIKMGKVVLFLPATALNEPEVKLIVRKLKGLRLPLGIYECGEEKIADIAYVEPLYIRYKTEYVRLSASEKVLSGLIEATLALGAAPLLGKNDLLAERSCLEEGGMIALEVNAEKEEEEEEQ